MMITAVVKRDLGSGNDFEETLMMAVNEVKIVIVETILQKSGNAEPEMLIRIMPWKKKSSKLKHRESK